MPVSNEERKRLADKEIEMYYPNRIDPKNNLRSHPNWNMRDYIYLRDKGYSSEEIRAIWDRDAAQGKPAQKHLNGPENA